VTDLGIISGQSRMVRKSYFAAHRRPLHPTVALDSPPSLVVYLGVGQFPFAILLLCPSFCTPTADAKSDRFRDVLNQIRLFSGCPFWYHLKRTKHRVAKFGPPYFRWSDSEAARAGSLSGLGNCHSSVLPTVFQVRRTGRQTPRDRSRGWS
jgi:hypothetical protein